MKQSEIAYQELARRIVQMEVEAGTPLREIEVAESLGLSRTPVRSALQRLVSEGLAVTDGRSVFVSHMTVRDVVELYQLREAVEPYATALCAQAPHRVFAELATRLAAIDDAAILDPEHHPDELADYYGLLAELDRAILTHCRNAQIAAVLDQAWARAHRIRLSSRRSPERMRSSLHEHRAMCEAVARGDAEAATSTTVEHLRASYRAVLADLIAESAGATLEVFAAPTRTGGLSSPTISGHLTDLLLPPAAPDPQ